MKTSKFQIIFISIFVVFIVIGVVLFATYKGNTDQVQLPPIVVWGTFPEDIFNGYIQQINNTRNAPLTVNYVKKTENNFDKDFIETLARGEGPDVILIPQDMILRHSDKVVPIPYSLLPERNFRDTYIEQGESYLTPGGISGLPFIVDPIVMYWNRDLYTNAGIASYPKTWEDFPNLINKLNIKDVNSNIRRSAIAMGDFTNITNAREILSSLFFQAGNPITKYTNNGVQSTLNLAEGQTGATQALLFFVQFVNPQSKYYSWNRSLSQSRTMFLSGNLASYFGFASELKDIRNKNPNLNFDVAPFPQIKDTKNRVTYGRMYGFSIVRSTKNQVGSFNTISELIQPNNLNNLVSMLFYICASIFICWIHS
jgi:ABC-type glycerol-3-phosphate transport system substrate-binding protein